MIPRIQVLAPNLTAVQTVRGTIWFSYETPIAFNAGSGIVACANYWSSTTGKHINRVAGNAPRLKREDFDTAINEAFA